VTSVTSVAMPLYFISHKHAPQAANA
jgi:hypothetical protein